MPVTCRLTPTAPDRVEADLLAVPMFADRERGPGVDAVDDALDGGLDAFCEEAGFEGKRGETLAVPTNGRLGARAAILVGLGARDELSVDRLRRAAAAIAARASKASSVATTLLDAAPDDVERADAAQAIAEGCALGTYRFLRYKSEGEPSTLTDVLVLGRRAKRVEEALARGGVVAEAVAWARDLVNEPAISQSPADVVAAAKARLRGTGVKVKVLEGAALERERMGGVLGVGGGSARPPRFLHLTYEPAGAKHTLGLVGKGVVFDSGGLSLKTSTGMETMKTDMSGAATVLATMSVLRDLGVRQRVVGYVPLVENMPSGTAIRPGDVLRMRDGTTVEVLNTDAEGRLILADALALAVDEEVDAMVDVATLTGACMVALGDKYAGLMGSNDEWTAEVRAAADRAGEPVWPLPLPAEYRKQLDSEVADLKNIGGSYGGALTAGLFLQHFTGEVPWAHLDIAGAARASSDDGYLKKGGTGFGVRTLCELTRSFRRPPR